MKYALLARYLQLRAVQKDMLATTDPVIGYASIVIDLKRIDGILFERYGYDVSLTRKAI